MYYDYSDADIYDCPDPECDDCTKLKKKISYARDSAKLLVSMLYSTEALDLEKFENDLEDLCHQLDYRLISSDLTIKRDEEKKTVNSMSNVLMDWKDFNNNYMSKLTKNA